jgi:hypothetical protein
MVKDDKLDIADILNQIESNQFSSMKQNKGKGQDEPQEETINTTKMKKQVRNLKRDGSKVLTEQLSGYKKVKIMRE